MKILVYSDQSAACQELFETYNFSGLELLSVDSAEAREKIVSAGVTYVPTLVEITEAGVRRFEGADEISQYFEQFIPAADVAPPVELPSKGRTPLVTIPEEGVPLAAKKIAAPVKKSVQELAAELQMEAEKSQPPPRGPPAGV